MLLTNESSCVEGDTPKVSWKQCGTSHSLIVNERSPKTILPDKEFEVSNTTMNNVPF